MAHRMSQTTLARL